MNIKHVRKQVESLNAQKKIAVRNQDYAMAADIRDKERKMVELLEEMLTKKDEIIKDYISKL